MVRVKPADTKKHLLTKVFTMCEIVKVRIGDRDIKVADIKKKYINNIADAAQKCSYIDRVVLFGSSIMERCRESSDIDIAVFGSAPKSKALTSKSFKDFAGQLYAYDDFNQSYDILYFKTGSRKMGNIMNDIENGEVIYAREKSGNS